MLIEMDDIESSANPSWDDNYHKYANGLNNFLDYYSVVSTVETQLKVKQMEQELMQAQQVW